MPIIFINRYYKPYFDTTFGIENKATGREKSVQLVLYQDMATTGFGERVSKKPIAKFFEDEEKEIPRRKWTPEMKAFASEMTHNNPVKPYVKFNWLAKTTFFVLGILLMAGMAALINMVLVSGPQEKIKREAFVKLPEVGDRFYGTLFGTDYLADGMSKATWMIIESVNPQDSTVRLRLASQLGPFTFDTKTVEHNDFSGDIHDTKFVSNDQKVEFRALNGDFQFWSTVYDNKFDHYKIPAHDDQK